MCVWQAVDDFACSRVYVSLWCCISISASLCLSTNRLYSIHWSVTYKMIYIWQMILFASWLHSDCSISTCLLVCGLLQTACVLNLCPVFFFLIISSYSSVSIPAHVCCLLQNIYVSTENLNHIASDCVQEIMSNTSVSAYVQDFLQNTFPPDGYCHYVSLFKRCGCFVVVWGVGSLMVALYVISLCKWLDTDIWHGSRC